MQMEGTMTHNSDRLARLSERVTHGPVTASRAIHHAWRVVGGMETAGLFAVLAGFPWYAAWIPGALVVVALRFVAVEWCRWRPIGVRYAGPRDGTVAASIRYLRS